MVNAQRDIPRQELAVFCRKWGIEELAVFGSILRPDFGPQSDIDLLYALKPDHTCGLMEYFDMKDELEKMLGRRVDLVERSVVESSPNWVRRKSILSSAERVYAG